MVRPQVFEIQTCDEFACTGTVVVLAKDGDRLDAASALAQMREAAGEILDAEEPLVETPPQTMHRELSEILDILAGRPLPGYFAAHGPERFKSEIVVDGVAIVGSSLELPITTPWIRCWSVLAYWNERLYLGETSAEWVVVRWGTGA